jgi:hypothetical protein
MASGFRQPFDVDRARQAVDLFVGVVNMTSLSTPSIASPKVRMADGSKARCRFHESVSA